jgi:DNA-binding MarR family transcriptional regulator
MNARLPAAPEPEALDARSSLLSFGPLAGIAGFHLARATVTTQAHFQRHIAAALDLNKIEFSLLMLVMANPGIVPKRLARALAITAPKLTLLLDGLQARNLVQRERNVADGRSQHLVLTERGRKLARDAAAAAEPMERELLSHLSRAEHAMLIELLGKLAGRP